MRSKNRCIPQRPEGLVHYLVDANFLFYHIVDPSKIADPGERNRAELAERYWNHITVQRRAGYAKVFVLDVCIAEAFKVLAKKYYRKAGIFPSSPYHAAARRKLQRLVSLSPRAAARSQRKITSHDIQTTRDIIIGVDRFFERAYKDRRNVGIIDLLILSTARYLVDFLGFDRDRLFIITMDADLYDLARSYHELPAAFNPDRKEDSADKVFV